MPSEFGARLRGIAKQDVDFGRPEVARVDLDQGTAITRIHAPFLQAGTLPFQPPTDAREPLANQFSDRVRLPGRQHVIIWRGLLQDEPHSFHIIACVAPITPSIQISKKDPVLQAKLDGSYGAGDLPCYKCFASRRTF